MICRPTGKISFPSCASIFRSYARLQISRPFCCKKESLIARFTGPIWGPPGTDRTQVGPMLAPWSLLSGMLWLIWSHFAYSIYSTPHFLTQWLISQLGAAALTSWIGQFLWVLHIGYHGVLCLVWSRKITGTTAAKYLQTMNGQKAYMVRFGAVITRLSFSKILTKDTP